MFSFKHRVHAPFSSTNKHKTNCSFDSESGITFWIELFKIGSGYVELKLCSTYDALFEDDARIFVLDLDNAHKFGDNDTSGSSESIRFRPNEWKALVDKDTNVNVLSLYVVGESRGWNATSWEHVLLHRCERRFPRMFRSAGFG